MSRRTVDSPAIRPMSLILAWLSLRIAHTAVEFRPRHEQERSQERRRIAYRGFAGFELSRAGIPGDFHISRRRFEVLINKGVDIARF